MKERAKELAAELKEILEESLIKDPDLTDIPMARARAIREEIQQMGFVVSWEANLNTETLSLAVEITLWEPKKDMSPEEQKIYDEWFAKVNRIKPPQ